MSKNYLYIYLARLDKKGIKVISGFKYDKKIYPSRISDINKLNLNQQVHNKVIQESYENRMQYDLWAETANSFNDLRDSLKKRGYTNLPMQQFTGYTQNTIINEKELVTQKSTMARRNSTIK